MLTKKQEKYINERIKGKSQREAYKSVYSCKGWKESSIDVAACRLEKREEVKERLSTLSAKAIAKAEADMDKRSAPAVDMRTRIIQAYQEIAFGDDGETVDECVVDDKTGKEIIGKRTKTAHRHKMAKLTALNKLAEIYAVTGDTEEKGIKIEIPDEYKDYLA